MLQNLKHIVIAVLLAVSIAFVPPAGARANDGKGSSSLTCDEARKKLDSFFWSLWEMEATCKNGRIVDVECMNRVHFLKMVYLALEAQWDDVCGS